MSRTSQPPTATPIFPINEDCVHYNGEKPCAFKRHCPGCPHYEQHDTHILIIKLGAMGDVLRTTPVLRPLRERYPKARIVWLVKAASVGLLKPNSLIDEVWIDNATATRRLMLEEFDLAYNFDKEPAATAAMGLARAKTKRGFGANKRGALVALNKASEYALALGISDELKFHINEQTYQAMTFAMAELPYNREEYVLELTEKDKLAAEEWRNQLSLPQRLPLIGINTGAGDVFATKRMSPERTAEIAMAVKAAGLGQPLLLGGPNEIESNRRIMDLAQGALIDTGTSNSLRSFMSLVSILDGMVCVDTLAMHVALALGKRVVALFGPTCAQEVDLYDRGEKLVTSHDCAPCYRSACPYFDYCMEDVEVDDIVAALSRVMAGAPRLKNASGE